MERGDIPAPKASRGDAGDSGFEPREVLPLLRFNKNEPQDVHDHLFVHQTRMDEIIAALATRAESIEKLHKDNARRVDEMQREVEEYRGGVTKLAEDLEMEDALTRNLSRARNGNDKV